MVEADDVHGIEETAGAIGQIVTHVPDEKANLALAKDKEKHALQETMRQLEAARDQIGPFCITFGEDVEGGMFASRKAILLAVPDLVVEGDGDNRTAHHVWTVVTEEGIYSLLTRTSGEGLPEVPQHLQEDDKAMHGFVTHAQRYQNGVNTSSTGLSPGRPGHISLQYPRYPNEPNGSKIGAVFYRDRRNVQVPDRDTVVAAVNRNVDAALQPLVAARTLAEQTAVTAGDATQVVLDRLSGFSSDAIPSGDPDITTDN